MVIMGGAWLQEVDDWQRLVDGLPGEWLHKRVMKEKHIGEIGPGVLFADGEEADIDQRIDDIAEVRRLADVPGGQDIAGQPAIFPQQQPPESFAQLLTGDVPWLVVLQPRHFPGYLMHRVADEGIRGAWIVGVLLCAFVQQLFL